ncbi:MAG: hypothetical protein JNK42_03275 [Caedimonas sp.]|nr:hypothetical protein [Caedimonas sp.]
MMWGRWASGFVLLTSFTHAAISRSLLPENPYIMLGYRKSLLFHWKMWRLVHKKFLNGLTGSFEGIIGIKAKAE